MGRSGLLCAGNWVVDRVKMIDAWPAEQTLANIVSESRQNGGAAFNVLLDLHRLGTEFPLFGLGCVGDDADGEFVFEACAEAGVDCRGLVRCSAQTSYTDVMTVRRSGRRTFFHHRGANALLGPEHFDFGAIGARHLHLGYLLLLDRLDERAPDGQTVASKILAEAKRSGMTTSIDLVSLPQPTAASIVRAALPYVDILFMNEFEAQLVTEVEIRPDEPQFGLRGASELLRTLWGFKGTLAIHAAEYAYVDDPIGNGWLRESCSLSADEIKGSVGAGDAFAAGYLLGYMRGEPSRMCLRWAIAAGASCLLGEGASNGVLPLDECVRRFVLTSQRDVPVSSE